MRGYIEYKDRAIALRRSGKTYTEIQDYLKINVPPSTLCVWFKQISFSPEEKERIALRGKERIRTGSVKASVNRKLIKEKHLKDICNDNAYLKDLLDNKDVAKICIAILYLGEGSKRAKGSLCFGNSNPEIIKLFLRLLRKCYPVDEKKFRCTIQHRADQDAETLKLFWSNATHIPLTQFYGYKPDKRTIGFPTKKVDYKGVCRIDYLSTAVYNEVQTMAGLL
jgi:hypothetical protein